jgi:glycosyltransferase involved in cell wall biosynthesis
MVRIAYLGSKGLPSKSGVERVVEAIVSRLAGKHQITVYCDARYTAKNTQISGVQLIRIPTIKGKYTQASSLFIFSAVHALFCNYDLIHLHSVDACFILPILRLKYKVISTSHGAPGRMMRDKWGKIAQFIIRMMELPYVYLSTYATSVSSLDADYLQARFNRRILYIPNGVDLGVQYNLKSASNKLHEVGFQPNDYLLFAAGRIDPTKGCHLVLEALDSIGYPLKLIIIGDLNQVKAYSDHLREIADWERVVFIPPISDRELLFGMMKQARIFIFPSIAEGMSMMLLEAASLGVPIICSDIPENKKVMQDTVVYFQSGDIPSLANQIQWALDHPAEISGLARKASAHVESSLTWEQIVKQYDELYLSCGKAP